jgi:hypothetical protein
VPVHERAYKRFDARPPQTRRPAALSIPFYCMRYARKLKFFWVFVVLGWAPAAVYSVIIYSAREGEEIDNMTLDDLANLPGPAYSLFVANAAMRFIQISVLATTFLTALTGGPALAEDLRRHALELYFSKPISAASYLLGKWIFVVHALCLGLLYPLLVVFANRSSSARSSTPCRSSMPRSEAGSSPPSCSRRGSRQPRS